MARTASELHALAFSHVDGGLHSRCVRSFFRLTGINAQWWINWAIILLCTYIYSSAECLFIGLGDRHPSNLMLDRISGKVAHVDFGDCFEVAMHREKFPEKIPFRLTRMLVHAMEVTGIEGIVLPIHVHLLHHFHTFPIKSYSISVTTTYFYFSLHLSTCF